MLSKVENYAAGFKEADKVKEYVDALGWKMRMDGRHLKNGCNRVLETINENAVHYRITPYTNQWCDIAPVLGAIIEFDGKRGVHRIGGTNFDFSILEDADGILVTYRPFKLMDRYMLSHLRAVANKAAYCVGCKACVVQCPTGAFTIQPNNKIQIRESICVHCSNCLKFTDKGCMIARSIEIAQGGSTVDIKGIGAYKGFGLRQEFLDFFFTYGVDCFKRQELGNAQFDGLKEWVKQSNLMYEGKLTPLGEKLSKFGAFNPFTWAIIWANLLYSSSICKWFCINIEAGSTFDKGDIVDRLDNSFSDRHRKNGATALIEILTKSPIGTSLQQAIEVAANGRSKTYLRDGWDMPDGVALLYSLYLYAEHTGRHAFTLTELIKVHNTPEAPGVSPADIYGLDNKKLRDCIQALALTFPEYIRVSFINDLDNIVLDSNRTSLSVLDLAEE